MSGTRADRARNLRYKRPALASMGFDALQTELWEVREACDDIRWFVEQGDETLLNALDGDNDEEWEFRMAFSDLEAKVDGLDRIINDCFRWDDDGFARTYNDCTVALVGNRYRLVGYDFVEEDYYALTAFEEGVARTEAGKRLAPGGKAVRPALRLPARPGLGRISEAGARPSVSQLRLSVQTLIDYGQKFIYTI